MLNVGAGLALRPAAVYGEATLIAIVVARLCHAATVWMAPAGTGCCRLRKVLVHERQHLSRTAREVQQQVADAGFWVLPQKNMLRPQVLSCGLCSGAQQCASERAAAAAAKHELDVAFAANDPFGVRTKGAQGVQL